MRHAPPKLALAPSVFPEDARALIYKPGPSPMTSGRTHTGHWKLRFERRFPPYIEPLMGWTGGDDTLTQVELSFPTAESAIAYARRQGLKYTVAGLLEETPNCRLVSRDPGRSPAARRQRQRLEWVERTLGPMCSPWLRSGPRSSHKLCGSARRASRSKSLDGPETRDPPPLGPRCLSGGA
jgi:hypothetical protein